VIGLLFSIALIAFLSFLMVGVAIRWLKTGNLTGKPSDNGQPTDRKRRPIRFWMTFIPIFNAGIVFGITSVVMVFNLITGAGAPDNGAQ
jgi:hypothetical protein